MMSGEIDEFEVIATQTPPFKAADLYTTPQYHFRNHKQNYFYKQHYAKNSWNCDRHPVEENHPHKAQVRKQGRKQGVTFYGLNSLLIVSSQQRSHHLLCLLTVQHAVELLRRVLPVSKKVGWTFIHYYCTWLTAARRA